MIAPHSRSRASQCSPVGRRPPHRRNGLTLRRIGYTLVELLISMGSATVLMTGMGSAVYLSSEAFVADESVPGMRAEASDVQRQVLDDLKYATGFSERTDKAVTFTVPDRTGDGKPETIRYAWSGTAGDPLTYAVNAGTPQVVAANVHQFALTFATETIAAPVIPDDDGAGGGTILFVSNGVVVSKETGLLALLTKESSLMYVESTSSEDVRIKWMESWGYTVNKISAAATEQEFQDAYAKADVVYVPQDVNATYIAPRLPTMTLGVVNELPDLVDDLGFCSGHTSLLTSSIDVVTSDHTITEGYKVGPLAVATVATPLTLLKDIPSPDLQSLAGNAGAQGTDPSLMALNAAARDFKSNKVATRRVQLPWGYLGFDPASLTNDGQELMRRSIDWAMGKGPDGTPNYISAANFGYEKQFASNWNKIRQVQVATRVTLGEAGRLMSMTACVGGAVDKIRYAIYADDAGEPGKLLAESSVGATTSTMQWLTLQLPETSLAPGAYWLALSFESSNQAWASGESGGQSRMTSGRAVVDGFKASWGGSTNTSTKPKSIYATYLPQSP